MYVMKMARKMGLVMSMINIFMVALMLKSASANSYYVGDDFGWAVPPNPTFYSEWASSKTFQIDDEIHFNWNGTLADYNVAEASTLTEYQNCTKPGIVFGKGIFFVLTSNGSRFFLSTVGNQCELGMKLIITVGSPTDTAAWPSASSSLPSLTFGGLMMTLLSLAFLNYV